MNTFKHPVSTTNKQLIIRGEKFFNSVYYIPSGIKTLKLMPSIHFKFLVAAVKIPGQFRVSVLINKLTVFFYLYLGAGRRKKREVVKTA
jgi:hypothetical protein